MFAPDYRKITDINIRKAIGWAYPYEDAAKASGNIVGVTRQFGTTLLPPGIPGRVQYDVLGNEAARPTRTRRKRCWRKLARSATRSSSPTSRVTSCRKPARTRSSPRSRGGLHGVAGRRGNQPVLRLRADPNSPINVRAFGWCSDWPSGGSWFPPLLKSGGSNNYAFFEEKDVDNRINKILELPVEEQPAAWGELDKYIFETYYPGPVYGYAGVATMHGSKIGGMVISEVFGEPTLATSTSLGKVTPDVSRWQNPPVGRAAAPAPPRVTQEEPAT